MKFCMIFIDEILEIFHTFTEDFMQVQLCKL